VHSDYYSLFSFLVSQGLQFIHVIEEANLHNRPSFDGNADFQVDGTAGFRVNSITGSQVDGIAGGFQVTIGMLAPSLFTPSFGSISSVGPALASFSNTLLLLHARGFYLSDHPIVRYQGVTG
jgi:hypothetical protein